MGLDTRIEDIAPTIFTYNSRVKAYAKIKAIALSATSFVGPF